MAVDRSVCVCGSPLRQEARTSLAKKEHELLLPRVQRLPWQVCGPRKEHNSADCPSPNLKSVALGTEAAATETDLGGIAAMPGAQSMAPAVSPWALS
jgi:hypothetical protein